MSPLDRPVPPSGEDIHIPGPSVQPMLLAVGITTTLLGVTISSILLVAGCLLTVGVLVAWIRDARHEFEELPADHHAGTHDTVPRAQDRPTARSYAALASAGTSQDAPSSVQQRTTSRTDSTPTTSPPSITMR